MKVLCTGIVAIALGIAGWQGRTLRELRERERLRPGEIVREISSATSFSSSPRTRIEPAALLAEMQALLDLPEHSAARFTMENALTRKLATTTGPEMQKLIEEAISRLPENPGRREIEQRLGLLLELFHPATVLEDCARKSGDLQRFRLTAWAWVRRDPAAYLAWHEAWRKGPEPDVPGFRLTALAPALLARASSDPQSLNLSDFAGIDEVEDAPELLGELAFSLPDHASRLAVLRVAASQPDATRRAQWVRAFAEDLCWNVSFAGARKLGEDAALPHEAAWALCQTIALRAGDVPVAERYAWLASAAPAASDNDWWNVVRTWAARHPLEIARVIVALPPSPRRDRLMQIPDEDSDSFGRIEILNWRGALARAEAERNTPKSTP